MSTPYKSTFNRYEMKYLVPHRAVEKFEGALGEYVTVDPHCRGRWGYPVHSVYWDSPSLVLFWEKVEGIKFRRKLRFRRYSGEPKVFVEIKQRIDRTVQKRRVRLPIDRARAVFADGAPTGTLTARDGDDGADGGSPTDPGDPVLSEALLLVERHGLLPRMSVAYRRRALFGKYEPELRITFDRRVQFLPTDMDFPTPFDVGRDLVDPRLVVMEIKYSERVPVWLCKLVSSFGFQMIRLSKYCTAVDRAYYDNRLT